MLQKIILVITIAVVMAAVDYLWLGIIAKDFYVKHLGELIRPAGVAADIRILSAAIVYVLVGVGITFLVLPYVSGVYSALLWGALFGFTVYGIYDFTNNAVLTKWSFQVVFADIVYGTVLISILTLLAFYLTKFFQ